MAEHFIDGVREIRDGSAAGDKFHIKTRETVPMKALICIGPFGLYLTKSADPKNVASALAYAKRTTLALHSEGRIMARLVSSLSSDVEAELISEVRTDCPEHDYLYVVDCGLANPSWNINVTNNDDQAVFSGGITGLVKWAASDHLNKYLNKVVQFRYSKGSRPGETRTIRVERVDYGKSEFIEGLDLTIKDLKESYRRYKISDIQGRIKILA